MTSPADSVIRVGAPHRALQLVEVLVYDYDALGVTTTTLRKRDVFQPWEPLAHWRGAKVPITFGLDARAFDWSVTSPRGHFLRWDDFFERCAPVDDASATAKSRIHEQSRASPFDNLAAIGARVRACAKSASDLAAVDALLARIAELQTKHAEEVACEWHSMGFDNMDNARRYAAAADDLLEEARALLQQARDLVVR